MRVREKESTNIGLDEILGVQLEILNRTHCGGTYTTKALVRCTEKFND